MPKYKAVIFDIDGTLTSTNELIFATFNFITKKYLNKVMSIEEITSLFGPTEEDLMKERFPEKYDEVMNDYYNFYRDNHHMASLYEGIENILIQLKERNVKLGVFTGKGRTTALITLQQLGIEKYFDCLVTGSDVVNHKPHREGLEKNLSMLNSTKEESLLVGDSTADIKAATAAKIDIASVLWDSYEKEKILATNLNSHPIFYSVNELKIFLTKNT